MEQYSPGTRDSEKCIFPDLTKVSVVVNGLPNMLYNSGIKNKDIWEEVSRFFVKEKNKTEHMNPTKFYTINNFGLLIDLHSVADQAMHSSGTHLAYTKNGVQLEIEQNSSLKDAVCHVFVISDSQFNIIYKQLESVQY